MKRNLDPLTLTRELLSFNTINPPGRERKCAEYLGRLLEDGGFETNFYEFEKERTSLIARMEGNRNKAPLCFSGHIDTIPLGNEKWNKDPFKGEVDGNRVYGRGSSDMKSGVAAMVVAALRLSWMSKGSAGIILVFSAGEETGANQHPTIHWWDTRVPYG